MDASSHHAAAAKPRYRRRVVLGLIAASFTLYLLCGNSLLLASPRTASSHVYYAPEVIARCRALDVKPGPPADFLRRKKSDRFVPGTGPTLIENATIWTGNDEGTEVFTGDVLLDRGLIKWIGKDSSPWKNSGVTDIALMDAKGAWLTPGIIDLHSHIAVSPAPQLSGAEDDNSLKGTSGSALPWLRSVDGMNTHDESIGLAVAGGLTTSLILPGSANAIGGQAYAIKLRPTVERTPTAMLLEPPFGLNGSDIDYSKIPRWRHMKTGQATFPEELQWEALIDVLRGKVKVQTHCYEAVDLDNFVRLSNEFQFSVAAFHHAHETYLVPDVLKKAYGDVPPASAMFASFSRYKREAYRHSEFAPRILHDAGLKVVMKSDHSAIVSRYLLHEAQQAHYYGLPSNIALRSVISTPADVMGYDHRIGYIRAGYDAGELRDETCRMRCDELTMPVDIVLWDSHPLQLGATPMQVFIDGIAQLESPYVVEKSPSLQSIPETPNFDKETKETINHEGLPPLTSQQIITDAIVAFTNVSNIWLRDHDVRQIKELGFAGDSPGVVVVESGEIICAGSAAACALHLTSADVTTFDLRGGSISPGLVSCGTYLGLQEISMEKSTVDGVVYDGFSEKMPKILGGEDAVIRAADGLMFATRNMLLAYRAGVTSGITAPASEGFFSGLSAHFSTGATHRLGRGAVIQDVTALHFAIGVSGQPSVSTQIATLRRLLVQKQKGDMGFWLNKVLKGEMPIVIDVHSADQIATLLLLKQEIEDISGNALKMTFVGASEAHLLAEEIGNANVGVILNPVRPFPATWESRRILPGPPLSEESALVRLLENNVTVGFGVMGGGLPSSITQWAARNTRFDVSWAYIEAGGRISRSEAIALASTNVERLLGVDSKTALLGDLVATEGGDLLDIESKVVGVISPRRAQVDLL
ncbi:hypothetical protein EW145_g1372 [Phellinidium pouzarii]|uniref:Amidohydrolase-related domain-containing protein n=1 Tax=Phellinidium pouzarii TaxID=167371 RepID=A0A4S4LKA8_9AGAM|nr:hypothetical protein EW145_g1372 [Phellinidium pouzarii]